MSVTASYSSRTANVNPAVAAADLMKAAAIRIERGDQLEALGYRLVGCPMLPNKYTVFAPSGAVYIVTLSVEKGFAHCDCEDFRRNGGTIPCKHLSAIYRNRARIDADSLRLTRAAFKSTGKCFVVAHVRNGKTIGCYVRQSPAGRLSTAPIPDEAIEAQCAEYDARGEHEAYEAQMAGWRSTSQEVF